jgi:hypothetical protein
VKKFLSPAERREMASAELVSFLSPAERGEMASVELV